MDAVRDSEQRTEELRSENEVAEQELSLAQKRKAIKEAKEFYGSDFKKIVGGAVKAAGKLRIKSETMHNLHSLGFGGSRLRELNDPSTWRGRKR